MLKLKNWARSLLPPNQPPSGGCVLKPVSIYGGIAEVIQPPSGGCVLKPKVRTATAVNPCQPPSGGCVLKPKVSFFLESEVPQPPSGGCVLKLVCLGSLLVVGQTQPPSGGCVLKRRNDYGCLWQPCPAAFGRLCVETD